MHKITKGLKKKKKGKKSKHKEDELFKPEELEAYRREHQLPVDGEQSNSGQNEEWKKFLQLTSGVDDILKKTQGDLDRIKSTSFFKRVPPPSEVKRKEEELAESVAVAHSQQVKAEQEQRKLEAEAGIVQVSESEEESGEEDDIFDTAYIDAIASGEVKLAYIPESPTEPETDDPFDTSYAERAILGPAVERKGKKLVPLGAAVEVLTGRVQAPTCATKRPVSNRRQILKERDLLLGSFDDNANSVNTGHTGDSPQVVKKTLLDDDEPLPLANEPIDLSKPIITPATSLVKEPQDIEKFIDASSKSRLEQEEDDEFAQLAVESLSKPVNAVDKQVAKPTADVRADLNTEGWNAFEEDKLKGSLQEFQEEDLEADPFDTTFAENIVPGKAELKVIENEVLNLDSDFDFNPRAERFNDILGKVNINVINPSGERESVSSLDKISEYDLNIIQPIHRDLLGGSNTDLSNLNDQPLKPAERVDDNYIEYCDPFDTSIVETVKLPGQTELKFLEQELLSDIPKNKSFSDLSDDEFDPRADEFQPKERTLSRPDVLNITGAKTVSFDLPTPDRDLLGAGQDAAIKKPLTPFYVRKNSLPGEPLLDDDLSDDPFDTSFVREIAPCKAELKIIEKELFNPETERHLSISDQDFDPRNDNIVKVAEVVKTIQGIVDPTKEKPKTIPERSKIDLLSDETTIETKVLTPSLQKTDDHEISYISDPFDTSSVASNILPGKTELKILETELIHSDQGSSITRNLTDPEFDPRQAVEPKKVDLFDSSDTVIGETLSPLRGHSVHFDIGSPEDIDPFDTSIANNIGPGKTELKLLESELI